MTALALTLLMGLALPLLAQDQDEPAKKPESRIAQVNREPESKKAAEAIVESKFPKSPAASHGERVRAIQQVMQENPQADPNAVLGLLSVGTSLNVGVAGVQSVPLVQAIHQGPTLRAARDIEQKTSAWGERPDIASTPSRKPEAATYSDTLSLKSAAPPMELKVPAQAAEASWKAYPEDGAAPFILGVQKAWAGDHEAALPYYQAALDAGYDEPRSLTFAALTAAQVGQFQKAADWSGKALAEDPQGELSQQALAINKLSSGRLLDSTPAKQQPPPPSRYAPEEAPPPPRPKNGASVAPSALELAGRYAAEARAAVKVGDHARAVERATRALEEDPDDARALNLRSAALVRMNRYEEARKDAERGLDLAAGYVPLLLTRAMAAGRVGKIAEAKENALEALRKDPKSLPALRLLAFSQAADRDREGMLATLRKAAPSDPVAAQVLSRALTLPDEADATVLFSDAVLFGEGGAPAAPAPKRGPPKMLLVVGASLLAGLIAGGVILLAGREREGTASWTPRPAAPPSEDSVGPYRILGTLGAGGMGVVYKAEDPALGRTLALKRMRDEIAADPRERDRFVQEARIVSKLDHPGIVRIYSVYEGPEGTFLVFELVDGKTLSEIIGMRGTLPFEEARAFLAQACEAVAYAHDKRVVHRDLKPSNIMQDSDGRVRVMDFGIARAAKDAMTRLTAQGTVAGTPGYMAPEQEEGRTSPAGDVYALGVCFYEMLSGRLPFEGTGVSLYQAKRSGKLPPLQAPAPAGTDAVLAKALHPDPAQRFASPRYLAAALSAVTA